jgi:hypothetical protein
MTGEPGRSGDDLDAGDVEQALTMLAGNDPSVAEDPAAALSQLGVDVPAGLRFDVRIQRWDTLYLVIPPAYCDDGEHERVVNQMDLWRSGDQFVWIMPQDAKVALLQMREQYGDTGSDKSVPAKLRKPPGRCRYVNDQTLRLGNQTPDLPAPGLVEVLALAPARQPVTSLTRRAASRTIIPRR